MKLCSHVRLTVYYSPVPSPYRPNQCHFNLSDCAWFSLPCQRDTQSEAHWQLERAHVERAGTCLAERAPARLLAAFEAHAYNQQVGSITLRGRLKSWSNAVKRCILQINWYDLGLLHSLTSPVCNRWSGCSQCSDCYSIMYKLCMLCVVACSWSTWQCTANYL